MSINVFRHRGTTAVFHEAALAMFPHLEVVIAYRLLFGIYSGIVPDGIADLEIGDIDWAGDSTVLLSYVKRRTAAESTTLPRPAVRLLEQWLAHSALLRSFVPPDEQTTLWLGMSQPGYSRRLEEVSRSAIGRWMRRHGIVGDDGEPLKLHRSRIRTTHHAMRDKKSWTGNARATIDPNHTARGRGRPLPVGDDSRPTPRRRDDHRRRPARHPPPRPPTDGDHRRRRRSTRRGLPAAAGGDEARRRRARRAGRRRAGCVHRGLRRSAGRAARTGRETMPGTPVGLPALPAGGVRTPARGESVAAQGILLPPDGSRCPPRTS